MKLAFTFLLLAQLAHSSTLPDSPGTVRGAIVETYGPDERMQVHNTPSEVRTRNEQRIVDWSFVLGHAIYGAATAFDNYETQKYLGTCAYEGNPDLGRTPTAQKQAIHAFVEASAVTAGDYLLKWFGRRQGVPRWMNSISGNIAATIGTAKHTRAGMQWVNLCK